MLSGRAEDLRSLVEGKPGEIRARHRGARRSGRDGEDVPEARHVRRRHVRSTRRSSRASRASSRGATSSTPPTQLRNHGSSSIKYGRGVGAHRRPHEPLQHDVRPVLHGREPGRLRPRARVGRDQDRSSTTRSTMKPRRQMSVQFSGGEPTLSPHFLRRHPLRARRRVTSACSARPTASASRRSRTSRAPRRRPGLRLAYLQFDGVTNEANAHRKVGNLFDVKLRAIENLHAAGIDVVLVVTVVNGRQQRPGRAASCEFADRQRRQDHRRLLPAGELHRARRGRRRRGAAQRKRYTL